MNSHSAAKPSSALTGFVPTRPLRRSVRVRFPGGNGFELAGIVDAPEEPDDDAPVVVLSHCFTCSKDLKAIVRLGRALAGQGTTVLRYDMTGLGQSDGDFSHTHFSSNLADLNAAIAFASERFGRVTGLLGHSFGGAASLAVAGEPDSFPKSIRSVATLAAPSDTSHLARLMVQKNPQIESQGHGDVEIGGRNWTIRQAMLADFRGHRLEDSISRIEVPLMLLHSPVDATVGFDHAVRILQLASQRRDDAATPAVSLVALDGADHLLAENPSDLGYVAGLLSAFFWRHRTS